MKHLAQEGLESELVTDTMNKTCIMRIGEVPRRISGGKWKKVDSQHSDSYHFLFITITSLRP